MKLLDDLVSTDPSSPRLTVYDENNDSRVEFSGSTLDNWTAKIANMLRDEFFLDEGSDVSCDLPNGWPAIIVCLGALAAGIQVRFDATSSVIFTMVGSDYSAYDPGAELVLVTDDPFGRGVVETGRELPLGMIDFSPTARVYGDVFPESSPPLATVVSELIENYTALPAGATPHRVLHTGWSSWLEFVEKVLVPWAAGGSVVLVTGSVSEDRLAHIARVENVTLRL